ncbi:MAG: hypothetical protein GEV11_04200 [Streptosporangiales bacterium]|nr:hypothetical protein [Streptosporangiales bacterium]
MLLPAWGLLARPSVRRGVCAGLAYLGGCLVISGGLASAWALQHALRYGWSEPLAEETVLGIERPTPGPLFVDGILVMLAAIPLWFVYRRLSQAYDPG